MKDQDLETLTNSLIESIVTAVRSYMLIGHEAYFQTSRGITLNAGEIIQQLEALQAYEREKGSPLTQLESLQSPVSDLLMRRSYSLAVDHLSDFYPEFLKAVAHIKQIQAEASAAAPPTSHSTGFRR